MRKIFIKKAPSIQVVIAAIVVLAFTAPAASAAWQQLPSGLSPVNVSSARDSNCLDVMNIGGDPWISWAESNGATEQTRVKRLGSDGASWVEPATGSSPINNATENSDYDNSCATSLADFGGVPYVAWSQFDGVNYEIRVAKLNTAGTAWERVGETLSPFSPINHGATFDARSPSLANIGGVPWVAWREYDGTNFEVRVAKLTAAGNGWEQVVGGSSPINASSILNANDGPALTTFGGLPVVAWTEIDGGGKHQVRVARLNALATDWVEIVGGPRPLNYDLNGNSDRPDLAVVGGRLYAGWEESTSMMQARVARLSADESAWQQVASGGAAIAADPGKNSYEPRLADFGGVPFVTWWEGLGVPGYQIRVARLNDAGDGWLEIVGGTSPVNDSPTADARNPQIAAVGGVPYVLWREWDGVNYENRVSRLVPEFSSYSSAVSGGTGATLSAVVETYGVAYPFEFLYGATSPWGGRATATSGATVGPQTVSVGLTGLTPATTYGWRVAGHDGKRTIATGPDQSLTTGPKLSAKISKCRSKAQRRKRVTCVISVNIAGRLKGTLKQGSRKFASVDKRFKSGTTKVTIKLKRRPRGKRKFAFTSSFTADDGQTKKLSKQKFLP